MAQAQGPETQQPPLRRLVRWVVHRSPAEWVAGLSLSVLLISGLFGGLREVAEPATPTLAAGSTVTATPFKVSIEAVSTGRVLPRTQAVGQGGVAYTSTEGRYLVVKGGLTNTSERTVSQVELRPVVQVSAFPGAIDSPALDSATAAEIAEHKLIAPATVLDAKDGSRVTSFQPGVHYDLVWLFEQAPDAPRPTHVTLTLNGHTWRMDQLDFSMKWKDPAAVATGDYAVTAGDERSVQEIRGAEGGSS